MTTRNARARLDRIRPFVGDGLLAVGIAIAAGAAATGVPESDPLRALLVLYATGSALTLAVRRLYPVAVFGIAVVATGFFAWAYDVYWPFAALLAFYTLAAHCPRRRAIMVGSLGLVALAVPIAHAIHDWQPLTWSRVALFAGRLAPLVAAWILGDNMRTRRAYVHAVEDRATQLEREHEANARRAAAEEQARIAREVHDIVAHNLSVIIVQSTAADAVFDSDPTEAQRAVRTIGTTARQALDELRRVLGVVRDGEQPPDFSPQPQLSRLEDLLEQVRTAGLDVELEVDGQPRELPPALELSAYRIVQEALTNTLRHAGARHATVTLRFDTDSLGLEIVDDGQPSVAGNGGGRGVIGMRERAAAFGGRVEAGPDVAGGFRVAARLPLGSVER